MLDSSQSIVNCRQSLRVENPTPVPEMAPALGANSPGLYMTKNCLYRKVYCNLPPTKEDMQSIERLEGDIPKRKLKAECPREPRWGIFNRYLHHIFPERTLPLYQSLARKSGSVNAFSRRMTFPSLISQEMPAVSTCRKSVRAIHSRIIIK